MTLAQKWPKPGPNSGPVFQIAPQRLVQGTSLIRNNAPLGPYTRTMPMTLWWSWGRGLILISEVPLYNAPPGQSTAVRVTRVSGSGFRVSGFLIAYQNVSRYLSVKRLSAISDSGVGIRFSVFLIAYRKVEESCVGGQRMSRRDGRARV